MNNEPSGPPSLLPATIDAKERLDRKKKIAFIGAGVALLGSLGLGLLAQHHFSTIRTELGGFVLSGSTHVASDAGIEAGVHVKDQLSVDDVAHARSLGYGGIIDMRPDGEEAGQPASSEMKAAAWSSHIRFAYVPVPHGDIPDSAVVAFRDEYELLAYSNQPVLIYCRSGRRAARTWALATAAYDTLPIADIEKTVKDAGQDASDLDARMKDMRAHRDVWVAKLKKN